ncbi:MAG: hypothetical protein Q4D65_05540 [Peptostreptococcaceae bacterium]|nr:hypothetical protein [Peptostreptococcaceae bacterium]
MLQFGTDNSIISRAPFLIKMVEGEDNDIAFVISFAAKGEEGERVFDADNSALNKLLAESAPLYPDENNSYEIIFEDYVLHLTRNESFTTWDDYEIRHGRYLVVFERSRLLDSMSDFVECVLVQSLCKNKNRHYGIYCQNHIIDIITPNEPIIRTCSK